MPLFNLNESKGYKNKCIILIITPPYDSPFTRLSVALLSQAVSYARNMFFSPITKDLYASCRGQEREVAQG
jgi:hypothetical protein